ncbi:MAG: hypothetical protein K2V38_02815, partial [Gemmataceae bacterium]|nr:hypothetical protein [Gemmataceae bacterium]
ADLIVSAMPGYDIVQSDDGEPLIAVLKNAAPKGKLDEAQLKKAAEALRGRVGRVRPQTKGPNPMQPMQPGGFPMQPGGFPMQPPIGEEGPGGMPGGPGGRGSGMPGYGGQFQINARRDEGKVLSYVPLSAIDDAVLKGNVPAVTVIPVRLVTIHAVVPYKQQVEEIKRALRLSVPAPVIDANGVVRNKADIDAAEAAARAWGPLYDGFEVQRRESIALPDGSVEVVTDWAEIKDPKSTAGNYKFEERYIELIHSRKIGDQFDQGYLPYFLKPEMMLSMPLPLLVKELGVEYPEVRLKPIKDNEEKLRKASQVPLTPSQLAEKLKGAISREGLYLPQGNN